MPADPCETILANLAQAGLLERPQAAELVAWCRQTGADPAALGREVLKRKLLTLHQLKEFQKGRAKQLFLGPYLVLDVLGEGGMGRVFKARHTRLGREVALKIIRREKLSNPVAVSRFRQEIHAAGQLSHPNVVLAFDSEETEAGLFLSMEYVEGTDLTKFVRTHGPMGVPQACDAIRQAALGLQHAHERGMVHRDIKPSNLLYTPRGQLKVLDLGLAMLHAQDYAGGENAHRVTQEGFVLGTPDFLAPEQAQNPMGVDIRADIYALGATLFYILTGKVPFEGANPTEKLLKHVTAPAPSVAVFRPDVPPQLDGVIRWMMAKQPHERPQTPAQVAMTLLPFCPPQSGAFAPPPSHQPFPAAPSSPFHYAQPPAYPPPMQYPMPGPLPQSVPAPMPGAFPGQESGETEFAVDGPAPAFAGFRDDDSVEERPRDGTPARPADPDRVRAMEPKKRSLLPLYLIGGAFALLVLGALGYAVMHLVNRNANAGKPLEEEFVADPYGVWMKKIEAGEFLMGSPAGEEGRQPDEGPQDEVKITKAFYMAATEVTFAQYAAVTGTPPNDAPGVIASVAGRMPVVNVSWKDASEFCRKLSLKDQNRRPGWSYRLPTEAEWEYCCRAGTTSPFSFGKSLMFQRDAVYLEEEGDAYGEQNPVLKERKITGRTLKAYPAPMRVMATPEDERIEENIRRLPNRFGLFDMHGNVWEWCRDHWQTNYDGPRTDPVGPTAADGDWRVVRGGAWNEPATRARSASREGRDPGSRDAYTGFRVVFAPDPKK